MLDRVFSPQASIAGMLFRMRRNIRIWMKMTSSAHANTLPLVTRDSLTASLRRIETLAALLCALSDRVPCEPLDGEVVGEAAGMITEEAAKIRATLDPHLSRCE